MRTILMGFRRMFKKMRLLDYVILGCILVVIGSFLFLRLSRQTQWITVLVKVQPDQLWWEANPAPWYAQSLSTDQKAYNSFGQNVAVVSHIQSFETSDGRNEILTELKLKTSYDTFRHQYEFNYQPVLVGKPIEVSFSNFSLTGMVTGINTQLTFVEKNVEVRIFAIHPWKISGLAKGLQAKDAQGNVIAEIRDIDIQNAQVYQFDDVYGRLIVTQSEDTTRKDVILKLRIRTIQYNDVLYSVDGAPIKIGAHFNLQFPSTTLSFLEISAIHD